MSVSKSFPDDYIQDPNDDTDPTLEREFSVRKIETHTVSCGLFSDAEKESLFRATLTPAPVVERITHDIRVVFHLEDNHVAGLTPLEQELVDKVDLIIRKGQCPSILAQEQRIFDALVAMNLHLGHERIELELDVEGELVRREIQIFREFCRCARDAAQCVKLTAEIRKRLVDVHDTLTRRTLTGNINDLEAKRLECVAIFQSIMFQAAEQCRKEAGFRILTLKGGKVTLEFLVGHYKKMAKQKRPH